MHDHFRSLLIAASDDGPIGSAHSREQGLVLRVEKVLQPWRVVTFEAIRL
jgi:hypothetical protein